MSSVINLNKGTKIGANISECGELMVKSAKTENLTMMMGTGFIHLPRKGIKINEEAILESISERLIHKHYDVEFKVYLNDLMNERRLTKEEIIKETEIEENVLNEILEGKTTPDKEILIYIGLSLKLNKIEILHFLARLGYIFRPNSIEEDFVVLYGIENELSIEQIKYLVWIQGMEVL